MNNLVMHDPELLKVLIECFFTMRKKAEEPPTVPGLALSIGYNRVFDITSALKEWEQGDSKYPDESIYLLISSLTRIEDYCLVEGLKSNIPAALVKFTLGAYHDVKEPQQQAQPITAIQVVFESPPTRIAADAEQKQLQGSQSLIEVTQ